MLFAGGGSTLGGSVCSRGVSAQGGVCSQGEVCSQGVSAHGRMLGVSALVGVCPGRCLL